MFSLTTAMGKDSLILPSAKRQKGQRTLIEKSKGCSKETIIYSLFGRSIIGREVSPLKWQSTLSMHTGNECLKIAELHVIAF
jgi:hypothetical protein